MRKCASSISEFRTLWTASQKTHALCRVRNSSHSLPFTSKSHISVLPNSLKQHHRKLMRFAEFRTLVTHFHSHKITHIPVFELFMIFFVLLDTPKPFYYFKIWQTCVLLLNNSLIGTPGIILPIFGKTMMKGIEMYIANKLRKILIAVYTFMFKMLRKNIRLYVLLPLESLAICNEKVFKSPAYNISFR